MFPDPNFPYDTQTMCDLLREGRTRDNELCSTMRFNKVKFSLVC